MAPIRKPAGKVTRPVTSKVTKVEQEDGDVVAGAITVQRTYTEDGEINSDPTETIEVIAFPERAPVSRVSVLLGGSTEYGASKASVTVSVPYLNGEFDTAFAHAKGLAEKGLAELAEIVATTSEGSADTADDSSTDEGEEIDIDSLDRAGLIELIEEHGLEIDPDDHKKNAVGLKNLRAAVTEALTADDDGSEGDGDGEEGDEVTEEEINAMDRKQLEAFVEENGIEVDPSDFKKTPADLKKFKAAVVEAVASGDDGEEGDGYTQEELEELEEDDLKAIFKEWDLGAYPKGTKPGIRKAQAIEAILEAQGAAE